MRQFLISLGAIDLALVTRVNGKINRMMKQWCPDKISWLVQQDNGTIPGVGYKRATHACAIKTEPVR